MHEHCFLVLAEEREWRNDIVKIMVVRHVRDTLLPFIKRSPPLSPYRRVRLNDLLEKSRQKRRVDF